MEKTTYKLEVSDRCGRINRPTGHGSFWLKITNTSTGASRDSYMLKFGYGKWEERDRSWHGESYNYIADDEPWAVFNREAGVAFQQLMDMLFCSNEVHYEFKL